MATWKDQIRRLLGDTSRSTTVVASPVAAGPKTSGSPAQVPTLQGALAQLSVEAPRHPLDEQVEVVGETYYVKGMKRVFAERGLAISERGCSIDDAECILVPEPWNPHDSSAVAILIGQHHVGYLPAELAATYATGLGRLAAGGYLASGEARIWAKSDKGMVRGRVTVLIPEADAFR